MAALEKLAKALGERGIDPAVVGRILHGSGDPETDPDGTAIVVRAMAAMDRELDFRTRSEVRDGCACSKHGWREKSVRQVAKDHAGGTFEERLRALGQVKYMGNPVLNGEGTITGGVGTEGGFPCPCPQFRGWNYEEPVSTTYCMCCGGHFRHHWQIALGVNLRLRSVDSSVLASRKREPCRFTFEIVEPRKARKAVARHPTA